MGVTSQHKPVRQEFIQTEVPLPFKEIATMAAIGQKRYDDTAQSMYASADKLLKMKAIPGTPDDEYMKAKNQEVQKQIDDFLRQDLFNPNIYNKAISTLKSLGNDPRMIDADNSAKVWEEDMQNLGKLKLTKQWHPGLDPQWQKHDSTGGNIYQRQSQARVKTDWGAEAKLNIGKEEYIENGVLVNGIRPEKIIEWAKNTAGPSLDEPGMQQDMRLAKQSWAIDGQISDYTKKDYAEMTPVELAEEIKWRDAETQRSRDMQVIKKGKGKSGSTTTVPPEDVPVVQQAGTAYTQGNNAPDSFSGVSKKIYTNPDGEVYDRETGYAAFVKDGESEDAFIRDPEQLQKYMFEGYNPNMFTAKDINYSIDEQDELIVDVSIDTKTMAENLRINQPKLYGAKKADGTYAMSVADVVLEAGLEDAATEMKLHTQKRVNEINDRRNTKRHVEKFVEKNFKPKQHLKKEDYALSAPDSEEFGDLVHENAEEFLDKVVFSQMIKPHAGTFKERMDPEDVAYIEENHAAVWGTDSYKNKKDQNVKGELRKIIKKYPELMKELKYPGQWFGPEDERNKTAEERFQQVIDDRKGQIGQEEFNNITDQDKQVAHKVSRFVQSGRETATALGKSTLMSLQAYTDDRFAPNTTGTGDNEIHNKNANIVNLTDVQVVTDAAGIGFEMGDSLGHEVLMNLDDVDKNIVGFQRGSIGFTWIDNEWTKVGRIMYESGKTGDMVKFKEGSTDNTSQRIFSGLKEADPTDVINLIDNELNSSPIPYSVDKIGTRKKQGVGLMIPGVNTTFVKNHTARGDVYRIIHRLDSGQVDQVNAGIKKELNAIGQIDLYDKFKIGDDGVFSGSYENRLEMGLAQKQLINILGKNLKKKVVTPQP